jgi:hypothetical protein
LKLQDLSQEANGLHPVERGQALWSIYFHLKDPGWILTVHIAALVVIVLFTVGFCTPVTAVLTWAAAMSYVQRLYVHLYGQDAMMMILLFYLMIGPSGAALSVDRWLARWWAGRYGFVLPLRPQPSVWANFVVRLIQVHFCLIYLAAGTSKMLGSLWWNGTAPYFCMANASFAPMRTYLYYQFLVWLCKSRMAFEVFMNFSTFFTLFTELGFTFLVWNKRWRWFMVSCSILLHLGIGLSMGLVTFSLIMLTMVVVFVPPEVVRAVLAKAAEQGRRLFQSPRRRATRPTTRAEELALTQS